MPWPPGRRATWAGAPCSRAAMASGRSCCAAVPICACRNSLAPMACRAAETLSQMYNAAEDGLGADKVALSSSFEGVVMISPAP